MKPQAAIKAPPVIQREGRDGAGVLADMARDGLPVLAAIPEGGTVVAAVLILKTVTADGDVDIEVAASAQCGWYDQAAMIRVATEATERAATLRGVRNILGEMRPGWIA